ncbi:hypothetical protein CEXT_138641 [Caerostris extrusa]|uniref:Uncharacterized protein n=1 Tax=Caerostris extrusa TaxID=172846 RepID=A0AAV4UWG7_CAEEX|nr:hypothetical protein CEXT_138641 [Caerostris extrusa]
MITAHPPQRDTPSALHEEASCIIPLFRLSSSSDEYFSWGVRGWERPETPRICVILSRQEMPFYFLRRWVTFSYRERDTKSILSETCFFVPYTLSCCAGGFSWSARGWESFFFF